MKNWGIYILAAIGFVTYDAMTSADRDESGAIVGSGTVDAFNVKVGDCFDDSSSFDDEISSLPGVPCADPHDNEAYAVFDVNVPDYPGDVEMETMAYDSCMDRFDSFVGTDYESSSLDVFTMFPSPESWKQDDRQVVCAVYHMDYDKLEGTMKASAY